MKKNIIFWITFAISIGLIITGFFLPPTGVIDGSVITAVGELLGFYTISLVPQLLKKGTSFKVRKGDSEIEIDNNND